MINCKNLSYSYSAGGEPVRALNGVDIEIGASEYIAIMGPNGSGKSTLGKILSGILSPFEGSYLFCSMDVSEPAGAELVRHNTGMVFQNPDNQAVGMTVESEIAFPMENIGMPPKEIRRRVDEVIDIFGLKNLIDRPPLTLSGGERQKVIIASVLAGKPGCLILDEPTSLLDRGGSELILELLENIFYCRSKFSDFGGKTDKAATILHITQFPDEALSAERLIILDDGRIVYDGKPEEVFKKMFAEDNPVIPLPKLMKAKLLIQSRRETGKPVSKSIKDTAPEIRGTAYRLTGVEYSYKMPWGDPISALNDISCEIMAGSINGLMGATGSGKSSLARIMAFLSSPDKGAVEFKGQSIEFPPPVEIKRRAGLSFQFPERQFFCEDVFREVAFGLKLRNETKDDIEKAVKESLRMVGLDYNKFSRRDPFTLSGGEKRRVGIAVTLALKPEVVILDEPTSALDGEGLGYLRELLTELKKNGITVIVISHNVEFMLSVCDRLLFLKGGRIAGESSTADILSGNFQPAEYGISLTPYVEYVMEKSISSGYTFHSLPSPEQLAEM